MPGHRSQRKVRVPQLPDSPLEDVSTRRIVAVDRVSIAREEDVLSARTSAATLAEALGMQRNDVIAVVTAISELATNIVKYARKGELRLARVALDERWGLVVVARDDGPGIADIEAAMRDGFSTGGSLGFGLAGARRLMDEFAIESALGLGTTVTMTKWVRR